MDNIDQILNVEQRIETKPTGRTAQKGKRNLNKRKTTVVKAVSSEESAQENVEVSASGKKKRVFTAQEQNKSISVGAKKYNRKNQNKKQNKEAKANLEGDDVFIEQQENSQEGETTSKKIKYNKNGLKVMFLGGVGEIGKNITALEYGDDILIIDCGVAFPGEDMPGVDLVIPDFTYLKENVSKIRGIVITHGHEDHIGSLPYLLKDIKVPVYASKLALTLLDNKLREHKITGVKEMAVKPRNVVKLGCFSVEFIKVNHSIPGAFALSITTPVGIVFHTGDFKIDFTPIDGEVIDLPRIAEIGDKGVTLLLCESTNIERPGYTDSEKTVGEKLERIFIEHATRRLFVATFSSNIYRLQQILDLAAKYNRRVAVVGRSMINNIDAGMKIGEFKIDPNIFIDIDKVASLEDKNVLILSTGSQGEPTAALSRLSSGEFSRIEIGDNDTVIFSSTPIPGNENMVNRVINNLYKKGAIVIHDNVHASGHACQEEIKTIHTLVHPKFFIPVHGEYRHLKEHTILAEHLGMDKYNMIIPEIGDVVEITKHQMVKKGKVPAGELLVDGLGIGDVGSVVLKDRKLLSEDGLVIVVIGVSALSGELTTDPYMITRGFIYTAEAETLVEEAKTVLMDTLATIDMKEDKDFAELRNQIRKPLRNFFYKKTKRTPMILPIIFRA